jgi:hypothetical protein
MPDLEAGFLYVDVTFRDSGLYAGMFVASTPDEGVIAASPSVKGATGKALVWADVNQHELPIRFRYSDRAKLAMG